MSVADSAVPPAAPDLAAFLTQHVPVQEGEARWAGGTMPLHIAAYLGEAEPPMAYVTSVRCVVLSGESVLALRNRDDWHCVPGGRREADETPEDTIRREVLEEAGWSIGSRPRMIGFVHLRHLAPRPPGYRFPHPDFLWLIYTAEAGQHVPGAKLDDDYEEESVFVPFADATARLNAQSLFYLQAALQRRAGRARPPESEHDATR
jgi:8-oxo-dGTP pyrophosphatase MutT (NUDIX family)